jgi:hypothetical protein
MGQRILLNLTILKRATGTFCKNVFPARTSTRLVPLIINTFGPAACAANLKKKNSVEIIYLEVKKDQLDRKI